MSRPALIMHGAALALLTLTFVWGGHLYPHAPDVIPTHWNASGEADAFSRKSIQSFFAPLLVAAGLVISILALHLGVNRSGQRGPAERRALDLTLGYVNLSLVALFAWVSYSSWYDLSLGPLFIAFALMAGLPVLVIYGLHVPAITAERKAMTDPSEPSMDPRYWVLGGFLYRNSKDPRTFVPKPPHTGVGSTVNIASTGGRLFLVAMIVLVVGSLALAFLL